ncbi:MAG: ribosomal protein S18-alanine N-acetyltransferase [Erysipelotrichaceae bacterium]|nr:ribosomal protein S18-alanine N-acetyltransferase [Erysipelotrichaceae bacterium]
MIRKAAMRDLDSLCAIEKRCFANPWKRSMFEYELQENPYSGIWVLEEKGEIIGYYDLWIIFERAEIANIAVDKPYQQMGYGSLLLNHLEQQATASLCETISLEVRVSNEKALRLYRQHDFIIVNTKPGYYKDPSGYEDAYFMMKGI